MPEQHDENSGGRWGAERALKRDKTAKFGEMTAKLGAKWGILTKKTPKIGYVGSSTLDEKLKKMYYLQVV